METKLYIDLSVIAYLALHGLEKSADNGGAWATATAEQELQRRITLSVLTMREQFKPANIYFCLDRKDETGEYWRNALISEWNAKTVKYLKATTASGDVRYVQERNALQYFADNSKVTKKWIKAEKVTLDEIEFEEIENKTERLEFLANVDGYKGARSRRPWAHQIPARRFAQIIGGTANALEEMIPEAHALRIPGFEADDIVATCVSSAYARNFDNVIVTKDSDWEQLARFENVRFYNLNENKETGLPKGFEDKDRETVLEELREKVLTGDTSDSIPPTLTADGKRVTKTKIDVEGWEPTPETLERNKRLIVLDYEEDVALTIGSYLQQPPQITGVNWSDVGINEFDFWYCKQCADLNNLFEDWNDGVLFGFHLDRETEGGVDDV